MVFNEPDEEALACVLVLSDSQGGDGILATNDIRTIADLRGKAVAFGFRGISQFYVNVLLKEAGLSEARHRGERPAGRQGGRSFHAAGG